MALISFANICQATTDAAGMPAGSLASPSRTGPYVQPRFAAVMLARRLRPDLSSTWLGHHLGGRDHSSILHANVRAETLLATDPNFRQLAEDAALRLGLTGVPPAQPDYWADSGRRRKIEAAGRRLAHLRALLARTEVRIALVESSIEKLARATPATRRAA